MGTDGISNNKPIIKPTAAKEAELVKELKSMDKSENLKISFDEFFAAKKEALSAKNVDITTIEAERKKAEAQFKMYDTTGDGELNIDEFTELRYYEENLEPPKNAKEVTYKTESELYSEFQSSKNLPKEIKTEEDLEKVFNASFEWHDMQAKKADKVQEQLNARIQAQETAAPAAPGGTQAVTRAGRMMEDFEKKGKGEVTTDYYLDGTVKSKKMVVETAQKTIVLVQEFYADGSLNKDVIYDFDKHSKNKVQKNYYYSENGQLLRTEDEKWNDKNYNDEHSHTDYYENGVPKKTHFFKHEKGELVQDWTSEYDKNGLSKKETNNMQ